ncbi:MAG TPA: DNA ligase (NAD(+)) LigA, partial [Spirochaetia bacterium]|nr:DNA ligase (NAD(+)) LigA [Spirochaetia bacterium]
MSREREREEIDSLVETLKRLQKEYYVNGRISVPDREYDGLFDRLQSLEHEFPDLIRDDSPTQRVGSDLSQEFPEVEHSVPVLSLDKCYSVDEIFKWTAKVQDTAGQPLSFVLEEKIDGASIVLYYEQGRLIRAVTRGNGLVGNDITGNVRTIRDVPLMLTRPLTLSCRGEIFLPKRLFEELNSKMEIPYANPRNLAAGTLRRIRSSEVARIPLDIFIYEGYMVERCATHLEILGDLNDLGFKLNPNMGFFTDREEFRHLAGVRPSWRFGSLSDMKSFVEEELKERDTLDYEIDGLVLKVNEIPVRDDLGYTGHHPRWAVAYKFESPVGKTVVRNIEVQIGRTGRATPVARVSPVRIS